MHRNDIACLGHHLVCHIKPDYAFGERQPSARVRLLALLQHLSLLEVDSESGSLQVFDDPKKKRNVVLVLGVTLGLFIIYLLAQRARKQ